MACRGLHAQTNAESVEIAHFFLKRTRSIIYGTWPIKSDAPLAPIRGGNMRHTSHFKDRMDVAILVFNTVHGTQLITKRIKFSINSFFFTDCRRWGNSCRRQAQFPGCADCPWSCDNDPSAGCHRKPVQAIGKTNRRNLTDLTKCNNLK